MPFHQGSTFEYQVSIDVRESNFLQEDNFLSMYFYVFFRLLLSLLLQARAV